MSDQDQSQQRIYCGNGKKITTQYGDLMKLSFSAEDIQKLQDNLNNGWVNAVLKERREPSPAGTTHFIQIDTWKPKTQDGEAPAPAPKAAPAKAEADEEEISAEDLPF